MGHFYFSTCTNRILTPSAFTAATSAGIMSTAENKHACVLFNVLIVLLDLNWAPDYSTVWTLSILLKQHQLQQLEMLRR